MIKRYKIKNDPILTEVIEISDLESILKQDGFYIFILDSQNPDEIYDFIEEIGASGINGIVATSSMTVHEILEELEKKN